MRVADRSRRFRRGNPFVPGRRAMLLLLAAALAMQAWLMLPPGKAHADADGMAGTGFEGDPYIVTSAEQLNRVRDHLDAWYVLGNDIALTGNWTPIGNYVDEYGWWYNSPFTGRFDGAGKTISGLSVDTSGTYQSYAGLFGEIGAGGVVENLTLQSPAVSAIGYLLEGAGALAGKLEGTARFVQVIGGTVAGDGTANVGGLIGSGLSGSRIENSHSSASVRSNYGSYGGLVGTLEGGTVTDSYAEGNVDDTFNYKGGGGLIGSATDATIGESHASGDVTGGGTNGGLIGYAQNTEVRNSYAEGSVATGSYSHAGGLIGQLSGGEVTDSYASGNISGSSQIGGLIGSAAGTAITGSHASGQVSGSETSGGLIGSAVDTAITGSHASGQVSGSGTSGGLIGYAENVAVQSSYAAGSVSAGSNMYVGGLIGSAADTAIAGSHASGQVSGSGTSGGLIGYAESSEVEHSYAEGNVFADDGLYVGGLIGQMSGGEVTDSYASGNTSGSSQIGGLAGSLENDAKIIRSYALGFVSGGYDVGGLAGNVSGSSIALSFAEGDVSGVSGSNTGGLIGYLSDSSAADSYAWGDVTGSMSVGGLIGFAENDSQISRSYANGNVEVEWFSIGGLIGTLSADSAVSGGYYDTTKTGQSDDEGRGEPRATALMGQESTYVGWDFSHVWQLDGRIGYPALIAFDTTPPAIKSADVKNEASDRIEVEFEEKVVTNPDLLAHFRVYVNDAAADVAGLSGASAGGETRGLALMLDRQIMAGQDVRVEYEARDDAPIRDLVGNEMGDGSVDADNQILSGLEFTAFSPSGGAEHVPTASALTLTFSDAVTAVPGKRIEIRKSADGRLAEAIDAGDADLVRVDGDTATIVASTALAPLTGYYVLVEAGAFRDTADRPSRPIVNASLWRFTTAADDDAGWVHVGSAGFSEGKIASPSLANDNSTLYLAFEDLAHANKITVMKYANSAQGWQPVGAPGFSADAARNPSLFVAGGILYVAYEEQTSGGIQVAVMKFDGAGATGWTAVGAPLPAGTDSDPSLYVDDGIPYAAYRGTSPDNKLVVMKYDAGSGNWIPLGDPDGISVGDINTPSLASDEGTLYVAYQDYVYPGFGATVMKYDAGNDDWLPVGPRSFTGDAALDTSLAIDDGTLYVSYEITYLIDPDREDTQHKAAVMKYDAASGQWTSVGAAGFSEDQAFYTSLGVFRGEPYAAYMDIGRGDKATVMKYTGSRWVALGGSGLSEGAAYEPSLVLMDGIPHVAFEDKKNGNKATVMAYTVNNAPSAGQVEATGTPKAGLLLTGSYTYHDAEDDPEGASAYRWYTADDESGTNRTVIEGATNRTLLLGLDQLGKYILFEVTPKARSGKLAGTAVSSAAIGPVETTTAPIATAYSPAAGSGDAAVDTPLSLAFNEGVSAVSGKQLTLWRQADNSLVEALDAANPLDVSVTGVTYSYRLAANLAPETAYYVLIDAGAFKNADGVEFAGIADASLWTFTTASASLSDDSANADLASLTLSGAAMSPAFRPGELSYSAHVPYPVRSVTVTAAVYDDFATLIVNGRETDSGEPASVALGVGNNPIHVEVIAQDRTTKKLYIIHVTRTPLPDEDPEDDEPGEETEETEAPDEEGFEVIVNGQPRGRIASGKLARLEGRSALAVKVDTTRLTAQLEQTDRPDILIPVAQDADQIYVELTGDAAAALNQKSGVLILQTPLGAYRIPAAELPVGQWMQQLGEQVDPAAMIVRISIAKSDANKQALLREAAGKGDFLVAAPPVDFSITVSYEGRSVAADRFDSFVEREIPLPEGADPSRITTAVVLEPDGTVRHVPTYISRRDDRYYAVVNSLTNSTYALIWHPVSYPDMEKHWAREAVHDMGSRLIVSGFDDTSFRPDAPITRAQFASIVVRALGLPIGGDSPAFRDVSAKAWYAKAVATAAEYGLIRGYEDGTFHPERTITRQEAMIIISGAMKRAGLIDAVGATDARPVLAAFADGDQVGAWAAPAVAAAVKQGIVHGYRSALHPGDNITRAETAVMVRILLQKAGLIDDDRS